MNDLLKRTLTGAVYVASVLAAICFNPIISSIYFGIIGIIALSEFYNVTSRKSQKLNPILAYLTAVSLYTTIALYSSSSFSSAPSFAAAFSSLKGFLR